MLRDEDLLTGLAVIWAATLRLRPGFTHVGASLRRAVVMSIHVVHIWKVFAIDAISLSQSGLARLPHPDRRFSNHPRT
jgi:hypothetical protein